jgi:hypothetical protein
MEAAFSSETPVFIFMTTLCHGQEYNNLIQIVVFVSLDVYITAVTRRQIRPAPRSILRTQYLSLPQGLTEPNVSCNLIIIPHYSSETLHKHYYGDHLRRRGKHVAWVARLEMHGEFSLKSLKGTDHLGDLGG